MKAGYWVPFDMSKLNEIPLKDIPTDSPEHILAQKYYGLFYKGDNDQWYKYIEAEDDE